MAWKVFSQKRVSVQVTVGTGVTGMVISSTITLKTLTERASTVSVCAVVIEISVDAERRQTM